MGSVRVDMQGMGTNIAHMHDRVDKLMCKLGK